MQFQKSTSLEIYTASSYDVDKVVSIVRSDFKHTKLVKDALTQYVVGLFTFTRCVYPLTNESITRVLVPGMGEKNTSCCSDETQ